MRRLIVTAMVPVFFVLLMSMPVVGQRGTRVVVDDDNHGSANDCDASDTAKMTIQEAVTELGPAVDTTQRTIIVCPGTYATGVQDGARVSVPYDFLTIVSKHGPKVTTISGAFQYGFNINANRVIIEGFTVEGGTPIAVANTGIFIRGGSENSVLRNIVLRATTHGICIAQGNMNIVNGNDVNGGVNGIQLGNCEGDNLLDNNTITNNTVRNNSENGILVFSNGSISRNKLVDNDIHDNGIGISIPSIPGEQADLTVVAANWVHDNNIGIEERGRRTTCNGNNIRNNVHDFAPDFPEGACAPEDNRLAYISLPGPR